MTTHKATSGWRRLTHHLLVTAMVLANLVVWGFLAERFFNRDSDGERLELFQPYVAQMPPNFITRPLQPLLRTPNELPDSSESESGGDMLRRFHRRDRHFHERVLGDQRYALDQSF